MIMHISYLLSFLLLIVLVLCYGHYSEDNVNLNNFSETSDTNIESMVWSQYLENYVLR